MTVRVETIGHATLYLASCSDVLGVLPACEAVVTDPPYGIAYVHSGGGRGTPGRRDRRSHRNALMPIHGDSITFDPSHLLGLAPSVLMFGADHYRARLPDGGTWIAWDKHCGRGPNDSFADAEFAWTNVKVKRNVIRYLWKGVACEKAGEDGGRRYHPTTKPVGLMLECLARVGGSGLVLDPYMGSGSTGVACIRAGRPFVGVEINPDYFDIACQRIDDEQRQGRLMA